MSPDLAIRQKEIKVKTRKNYERCLICRQPAGGKMFHYLCMSSLPDVNERQAWIWCENNDDPARFAEYVKVCLDRDAHIAERTKMEAAGDFVPTTVWHDGRVYTGNAVRVNGRWTFAGRQNRQFVGRRAHEIKITNWRSFNPRYKGRQEVVEGKDTFTVTFPW